MLMSHLEHRLSKTHTRTLAVLRKLCWLTGVFILSHMLEILDGRQRLALNSVLSGTWLLS